MAAKIKTGRKIKAVITEVNINGNTFENETFNPTMINYFYGKNGTGKSTISGFLKNSVASYKTTLNQDQFELLVYNNQFITEEIQSYGNIPGLFTITKGNADISREIADLKAKKQKADSKVAEQRKAIEDAKKSQDVKTTKFLNSIWDILQKYKKYYPLAVSIPASKKNFGDKLKKINSKQHKKDEIDTLYQQAFSETESAYRLYDKVPERIDVPVDILSVPIISSGSTPFADFLKELRATDWVKKGHDFYQHSAGNRCPYCQQTLPHDFEELLSSCFDQTYQKQIGELQRCAITYQRAADNLLSILVNNKSSEYKGPQKEEYDALLSALAAQIMAANGIWEKKTAEPSMILEPTDFSESIKTINKCIDSINEEIKKHNEIITNRKSSQKDCTDKIMEMIAFDCHDLITANETNQKNTDDTVEKSQAEMTMFYTESTSYYQQISDLSKRTINTTAAKDNINQLIRDAGFQGFEIRERKDAQYVYELVRKDGSVVKNLSEGERNFIGFLYFYNIVMNSRSDDGVQRDKVVVIDDPVSSMDSSALFSVAALVRNLEEICYNNYSLEASENDPKFIRQFICLTHNPFFFKEISYNHISDYECANFYELSKDADNHSHIRLCHKEKEDRRGYENYSPIRNNYEALWAEYRSTTDSVILMNVIRRILEYYFVQIGGFKENDLRKNLLERNKSSFPSKQEYDAAAAMIAYLNTGIAGFDDGLYFDANAVSVDQMRSVFKNIFYVLNQGQHYERMMG